MLARLTLSLEEKLNYRQTSLLQGVLMENIESTYAEYLHRKKMHPYSQYVMPDTGGRGAWWVVQTLNREAYENIIEPLMTCGDKLTLKHGGERQLTINDRKKEIMAKADLLRDFYAKVAPHKFRLQFLTPTAFRQKGRYVILPDIRLMCQNLMMKYSAASDKMEMADDDALEQMATEIFITRHLLRSAVFSAEKQNIPGFVGEVTLCCHGAETMARYLRMLLAFGEFAGVGIKTAMGMGAMKEILP